MLGQISYYLILKQLTFIFFITMLIISSIRIMKDSKNKILAYITIILIAFHFLFSLILSVPFVKIIVMLIPLALTVCSIIIYVKMDKKKNKTLRILLLLSLILYWVVPFIYNLIKNIYLANKGLL